ncbi:hypothetical protein OEZ86_013356 [Tetradesmus obliquus]|nr:hypothetical protein OEZ86_013356 [Tetradesmus obliquus]
MAGILFFWSFELLVFLILLNFPAASVAGILFFWSFELLVFLILLNFLLAIIVDAFGEVKEQQKEQTGIHVELWRLLSDRWRWLLGRWRGTYMDVAHMDSIMQQWAGISEEEEARQQQKQQQVAGEINGQERVVQVMGEDADQETLTRILLAVMTPLLPVMGEDVDQEMLTRILLAVMSPLLPVHVMGEVVDQETLTRILLAVMTPLLPVHVMGEDVDQETLTRILLAVMAAEPGRGEAELDEQAAQQLAALKPAGTREGDVGKAQAAAAFIMRRFGKSAAKAAAETLEQPGRLPGEAELDEQAALQLAALKPADAREGDVGKAQAAAAFIMRRFGKSAAKAAAETLEQLGAGGRELDEEHDKLAAALDQIWKLEEERDKLAAPLERLRLQPMHTQLGAGGRKLEEERDKLAVALERLAGVQRKLAEAQRNLMSGQKQLAEQQTHLVGLVTARSDAAVPVLPSGQD